MFCVLSKFNFLNEDLASLVFFIIANEFELGVHLYTRNEIRVLFLCLYMVDVYPKEFEWGLILHKKRN